MSMVELDVGVYAWLADQPGDGFPNAGLVVDADGATAIDTLAIPAHGEEITWFADSIGVRIRRTVLTASSIEFVGGSQVFTMSAMYGTAQTSAHLDQPPTPDIYRRLFPEIADGYDDDLRTRPVSHVVSETVQLSAAVAAHPFSGVQDQNLVAVVAGAGICFAGAVASFGVTPRCYQGDLARWADELDRLLDLAPVIVPGHGPVGGEEEVRELQGYLRACVAAEGRVDRIAPGPWDRWTQREHDEVNVERAAMVARGEDGIPTSMLRAAGLA